MHLLSRMFIEKPAMRIKAIDDRGVVVQRARFMARNGGVSAAPDVNVLTVSLISSHEIWRRALPGAIAILALLVLTTSTSNARHRHGHHRFEYRQISTDQQNDLPAGQVTRRPAVSLAQLLPRDWKLQSPDPNWTGKRFISPDGLAWFALYSSPIEQESLQAHMKAIIFGDGEIITYLRGEKDWIASSGYKSDRIFYRKAVVACAGRSWHHIAFEYPSNMKRTMDAFVSGAAMAVQQSEDSGCDQELWSSTIRQDENR